MPARWLRPSARAHILPFPSQLKKCLTLPDDVAALERLNGAMAHLLTDGVRQVATAARRAHDAYKLLPVRMSCGALEGSAAEVKAFEAADAARAQAEAGWEVEPEGWARARAEVEAAAAALRPPPGALPGTAGPRASPLDLRRARGAEGSGSGAPSWRLPPGSARARAAAPGQQQRGGGSPAGGPSSHHRSSSEVERGRALQGSRSPMPAVVAVGGFANPRRAASEQTDVRRRLQGGAAVAAADGSLSEGGAARSPHKAPIGSERGTGSRLRHCTPPKAPAADRLPVSGSSSAAVVTLTAAASSNGSRRAGGRRATQPRREFGGPAPPFPDHPSELFQSELQSVQR